MARTHDVQAPHSLKDAHNIEEDIKVKSSCCIAEQNLSSILVFDSNSHYGWNPVWWNLRESEDPWETTTTSGCKSGDLPTWNLHLTKSYWHLLETSRNTDTVLLLSRNEILFPCFQMLDVPWGLSSLTHGGWHMTHLNFFSLWHARPCVLIHNEKWLKQCLCVEHAGHHRALGAR